MRVSNHLRAYSSGKSLAEKWNFPPCLVFPPQFFFSLWPSSVLNSTTTSLESDFFSFFFLASFFLLSAPVRPSSYLLSSLAMINGARLSLALTTFLGLLSNPWFFCLRSSLYSARERAPSGLSKSSSCFSSTTPFFFLLSLFSVS